MAWWWPGFGVETSCDATKLFAKCVLVVTENIYRYYMKFSFASYVIAKTCSLFRIEVHTRARAHAHNHTPTHPPTHTIQNPHIHMPSHYKTHTYTPTHYKSHTHNTHPHIHTLTHYKTHTYTHPHITKPPHNAHTHTLQNKLKQPQ